MKLEKFVSTAWLDKSSETPASPTLKMYLNGMGFRGIERVTGVHHTTVINWIKQVGELLPNADDREVTSQVGELDELQTFMGSKKTKYGFGQQ